MAYLITRTSRTNPDIAKPVRRHYPDRTGHHPIKVSVCPVSGCDVRKLLRLNSWTTIAGHRKKAEWVFGALSPAESIDAVLPINNGDQTERAPGSALCAALTPSRRALPSSAGTRQNHCTHDAQSQGIAFIIAHFPAISRKSAAGCRSGKHMGNKRGISRPVCIAAADVSATPQRESPSAPLHSGCHIRTAIAERSPAPAPESARGDLSARPSVAAAGALDPRPRRAPGVVEPTEPAIGATGGKIRARRLFRVLVALLRPFSIGHPSYFFWTRKSCAHSGYRAIRGDA
jgi:hypothetical protein